MWPTRSKTDLNLSDNVSCSLAGEDINKQGEPGNLKVQGIQTYMYMYVCVYIYTHIHMYTYLYIYIHTF